MTHIYNKRLQYSTDASISIYLYINFNIIYQSGFVANILQCPLVYPIRIFGNVYIKIKGYVLHVETFIMQQLSSRHATECI